MNKFTQKCVCGLLCVTSVIVATGCGSGKDTLTVPEGLPNYEADIESKEVLFGGWSAPAPAGTFENQTETYITVENYRLMKELGLNFVNGLFERDGSADQMLALDCAKEAGMKYLAYWPSLINYGTTSEEKLYDTVKNCLEHEACMGLFIKDEPTKKEIDKLSKIVPKVCNIIKDKCEGKYCYVNLLPSIGDPDYRGFANYREYLNYYCAKTNNNMLSVDFYPYSYNGISYNVNPAFLQNLELDQKYAQAYGMEHWEFIQSVGGMDGMYMSYADYSHQIYTSMAFGAQTLQYFCVFQPDGNALDEDDTSKSLFGSNGKPTRYYNYAKQINTEIHQFDHVFMNYVRNWQGILPVIGTNNEAGTLAAFDMLETPLKSYPRIKEIKASEDTVIGCFKDKDGYDGFLAVNYSVPGKKKSDKLEITFKQAEKAVCYVKGEYSLMDLTDGKLELVLDAGQGAFIIPVKSVKV